MSDEARRLMEVIAEQLGTSQSAVVELAIRVLAKQEKVKIQKPTTGSARRHKKPEPEPVVVEQGRWGWLASEIE